MAPPSACEARRKHPTPLEVSGLKAGYGLVPVLRGIDLTVAPGEVIAVLGANGAGKSTLNKILTALLQPWEGVVRFDGVDATGADAAQMVAAGLIHVPEGRRIFPNLNV